MSTDDSADAGDGAGTHSHGGVRHTHAHGHTAHAHDFAVPDLPEAVDIFDTILCDGSQQEGLSLTVDDKLRVAEQLDHLGVTFIEGGWPGANPKDVEFFARAKKELALHTATLVAFGSTRRAGVKAETDAVLANLVESGAPIACIVAKSWDRHVAEALRTSLDEAVAMVADSVRFLRENDLRVFLDAEHFFDGYRRNPEFALSVLAAAEEAGAEALVLCDTNGGSLPDDVGRAVADVRERTSAQLGIHCHNDAGCAVANSLVAVQAGVTQVQGCINGYGERAGNTDLSAAIPNLSLKLNIRTIPADRLERLTPVAHHIAELVNIAPNPQQPYVGNSVFAHKGGLHASAVARSADLYEHVEPNLVGNGTRVVVSEMAGRSTLAMKADELGLALDGEVIGRVLDELKRLEHEGYHFEVADGSLELLLRRATGWVADFFTVESFRVITDHAQGSESDTGRTDDLAGVMTEATVKVHVGPERIVAVAEGNGPVNALDGALRAAIGAKFPALDHIHLTDYRVRVLDTGRGTGAVTRVLVDTTDGQRTWTTIGVSENIIEASWQALYDSIVFGLLHAS
ncbi:MAG: citramalate synthase [Acidimicrobiales bacterium]